MNFRGKRKSSLHETKHNLLVWLGKGVWAGERQQGGEEGRTSARDGHVIEVWSVRGEHLSDPENRSGMSA